MRRLIAAVVLWTTLVLPVLAHEGGHHAYGVVKEITAARLVVTDEHRKDTSFALTAKTRFLRAEKPSSWEKVMVGERVVVKGKDASGKMEATTVNLGADTKHAR
jgi:hypothetical protein